MQIFKGSKCHWQVYFPDVHTNLFVNPLLDTDRHIIMCTLTALLSVNTSLCLQKLHLEMMKDGPRVTAYQTAIREAMQFISGKVCCVVIT